MSRFCISIACDLIENIPQNVVDILKHLVTPENAEVNNLPDHRFFEDEFWDTLLSDARLPWFPGEGGAVLRRVSRYFRPANQGREEVFFYTFSFRCEGNDDGITDFIEFLDWIAHYSHTQGFVGYLQDEYDEHPTLVYFKQGKLMLSDTPPPPQEVDWA